MACPQQQNIDAKRLEKLTKYRQLAFETRERHPRYAVNVIPMIIGALGGGMKALTNELKKIFKDQGLRNNVAGEMQRTVLMHSESIIRRAMSGLIQGEEGTE